MVMTHTSENLSTQYTNINYFFKETKPVFLIQTSRILRQNMVYLISLLHRVLYLYFWQDGAILKLQLKNKQINFFALPSQTGKVKGQHLLILNLEREQHEKITNLEC